MNGHLILRRQGLTLVELLVSMAILIVLVSLVGISGKAVRTARMRAVANQQMAVLANAIEQYASFWPRWDIISGTSKIVVAEAGWPDWSPRRLFTPGVFESVPDFNDTAAARLFDVTDIAATAGYKGFEDPDNPQAAGDVLNANACLAYALTAPTGKGPYLSEKDAVQLADLLTVHKADQAPQLPPYAGGSAAARRRIIMDPWGTPYRYFWVYRDPEADLSQRAHRGFLPVDYAPAHDGADPDGGVLNAQFYELGQPKTAVAFVIESAGPDRQFGNVWRQSPSPEDIDRADDNLIVMP